MTETHDALPDLRDQFDRLRKLQRTLATDIFAALPATARHESARALGFWKRGAYVLDGDAEASLLKDYTLYEHKSGRATIERRMAAPGNPEDERAMLEAMHRARFTLACVTEVMPDFGARASDLFTAESILLAMEEPLREAVQVGTNLVGFLLPLEHFVMTTGLIAELDPDVALLVIAALRARAIGPEDVAALPASARAQLTLNLIGLASRRAEPLDSMVRAAKSGRAFLPWESPVAMGTRTAQPGRNEPCSCGSGLKYKKCCLDADARSGGGA